MFDRNEQCPSYPGCCCESEESKIHRKINQKIEHQLKKEKRNARKHIKLLLLGTGESGKSTFIRQMRIIHEHGFDSVHERLEYVPKIHQNLLTTLYTIIHAMDMLHIEYIKSDVATDVDLLLRATTNFTSVISWKEQFLEQLPADETFADSASCSIHIMCLTSYQSVVQVIEPLAPEHLKIIEHFWNDAGVQKCSKRRNEYNLMDSSMYYMARLEEILTDGYVPTVQDILRVRIPTNGINEYCFCFESINFLIVDVGGQRTERRKWIHCFENVTSIIFLVALNEFDQILSEPMFPMYLTWRARALADSQSGESPTREKLHRKMSQFSTAHTPVNRLEESKALFKTIVTSEWFRRSSVILFLNKYDLFEDKILYGPNRLSEHFPAYREGDRDPAAAADFILELFHAAVDPTLRHKRVVYSHFTCATDTRNMRVVFQAVKETILDQMLHNEIQIF